MQEEEVALFGRGEVLSRRYAWRANQDSSETSIAFPGSRVHPSFQAWNINGLPKDSFSVDNAVTIQNANRWPLMIDPQNQANRWIKNSYAQQNLKVVKLTDNDFMRQLDNCIQLGLPLLIENVGEDLDPSLEPILLKQVFKQGTTFVVNRAELTLTGGMFQAAWK